MRIARLTVLVASATALSTVPVSAQGHSAAHAASPAVTHGNPHTATSTPHTSGSHGTTTTSGGGDSSRVSSTGSTFTTSPSATSSTTTSGTRATTVSPIAAKISSHPQLASKLRTLLPQGMTLNQAASGFRNQGQFIAALHVSKNLGIPFAQLKAAMLGTTTSTTSATPMSLGQAIHKLRPSVDADTETTHATTQATTDLKTTTTSTAATTSAHR